MWHTAAPVQKGNKGNKLVTPEFSPWTISMMSDHRKVAIFWDYENCSPPLHSQGYSIVNSIRRIAHVFGCVTSFRAYLDMSTQVLSPKSAGFRSELQSSGLSIIDCPHNGKKDVVDKMILVDMLTFAVDHPSPATIILIAGDRDYAYAVSTLRLRQYSVALIMPPSQNVPQSLESQASVVIDWNYAILGKHPEPDTSPVRQPSHDLDQYIVRRLSREIRDSNEDPAVTPISATDLPQPSVFESDTLSADNARLTPMCKNKAASISPDIPGHPRVGSVPSRPRSTTQSTLTIPDVDRDSGSPLTKNNPFLDESLKKKSSSVINDAQHAIQDAFPRTSSASPGLERYQSITRPPLSPTIGFRDPTPSPSPPLTHNLDLRVTPLSSSSHIRTISGCTHDSYGIPPQRTVPVAGPFSPAPTCKQSDVITPPEPSDAGSVSAIMVDNLARAFIVDSAESCFNEDQASFDDIAQHPPASGASPPITVTPTYQMSPSPRVVSDSNVTMPNVKMSSQNLISVIGDNEHKYSSGCKAPPIEPFEDKIRRLTTPQFLPLINQLLFARSKGIMNPPRSIIAATLVRYDKDVYKRAGAVRFSDYTSLAQRASIVELGGSAGGAWIALHPNWFKQEIDASKLPIPWTFHNNNPFAPENNPCSKTSTSSTAIMPPPSNTAPQETTTNFYYPSSSLVVFDKPIPLCFQPLITYLTNLHKVGLIKSFRSTIGTVLGAAVYSKAGVSSLKEYLTQALDANIVQCGGTNGYEWVSLHPDVLSGKRCC